MYVKQADLLWGLDTDFIKELMDVSQKESHAEGTILFREGDDADSFYILLKGRVQISVGEDELHVHIASHGGEAFGWSGLVGRQKYSATGKCSEDTVLLKFHNNDIMMICEDDTANGLQFYKRLAGVLGVRLLNSYNVGHIHRGMDNAESFGSRQMIDSEMSS